MIVIDANILVALELSTDASENARRVAKSDSDWRLPSLWRVEFSNVLRNLHRVGKINSREAVVIFQGALERYVDAETQIDDASVLTLAMDKGLTSYDACYLSLAHQLGTVLVTEDRELIRRSHGAAQSMADWLSFRP